MQVGSRKLRAEKRGAEENSLNLIGGFGVGGLDGKCSAARTTHEDYMYSSTMIPKVLGTLSVLELHRASTARTPLEHCLRGTLPIFDHPWYYTLPLLSWN